MSSCDRLCPHCMEYGMPPEWERLEAVEKAGRKLREKVMASLIAGTNQAKRSILLEAVEAFDAATEGKS